MKAEWLELGIARLIRSMELDPSLELVKEACVAEVDWAALKDQKWLVYNYAQNMLLLREEIGPTTDENSKDGEGDKCS